MTSLFALLGLAAIFYRVFSKQGRERARQLPAAEKKKRLYIAGAGMMVLALFMALNILECYLHHVPILSILWIGLLVSLGSTAAIGRAIMRFATL